MFYCGGKKGAFAKSPLLSPAPLSSRKNSRSGGWQGKTSRQALPWAQVPRRYGTKNGSRLASAKGLPVWTDDLPGPSGSVGKNDKDHFNGKGMFAPTLRARTPLAPPSVIHHKKRCDAFRSRPFPLFCLPVFRYPKTCRMREGRARQGFLEGGARNASNGGRCKILYYISTCY